MAFPSTHLDVLVELGLGADLTADPHTWSFTDASELIYARDLITINRGLPDEATVADPCSAKMTANNRGGEWSTRNPSAAWFGRIHKGTPLRIRIRRIQDTFTRSASSSWGTPEFVETGGSWTVVGTASDYAVNGSRGTMTYSATNAERRAVIELGSSNQTFAVDCLLNVVPATAAINMGALVRYTDTSNYYWIDVRVNTDSTIDLRLNKRVAGVLSNVFSVATGLTNSTTVPQRLRVWALGTKIRARTWRSDGTEPSTWALDTTDTSHTTGTLGGCVSRLQTGNTNGSTVIAFDNFEVIHGRFAGFLAAVPPRWDVSGEDRFAPIEAKGLLYRLTQGTPPVRSALLRAITGKDAELPAAYWSLEDGPDATQAASGLTGGEPLKAIGSVIFAVGLTAAGALSACSTVDGGQLSGSTGIANGPVASWEAEVCVGWDTMPAFGAQPFLVGFNTPGSGIVQWGFRLDDNGSEYRLGLYRTDGITTTTGSSSGHPIAAGEVHHLRIKMEQVGADVHYERWIDGIANGTGTEAGVTLTAPTRVIVNPRGESTTQPDSICSVAIWSPARASPTSYAAAAAYVGEESHTRFLRLSGEDGIVATSFATESQAMGQQLPKTFTELIRECEASDQGFLFEDTDFGLIYQSHTERENAFVALALDYTTAGDVAPPLDPTDDDQGAMNDVEVKREGGSWSRLVDEDPDSELSMVNIGPREDSKTFSLYLDSQAYHVAGWRLRKGTFPGYRFPLLTLNLAAGPSNVDDLCIADLAFRTTIANPPDDIGPETIDLFVEGYEETLGHPNDWDFGANCALAGPYKVGEVADTTADQNAYLGRYAEDPDCALRVAVDDNDTSFEVDPNRYRWTTVADDFDPDIRVRLVKDTAGNGGELVTVSAIATTAGTFVAVGADSHADNAAVTPALYAGGTARDLIVVVAAIRSSGVGSVATPTGYTRLEAFDTADNVQVFAKVHTGSESNPTVTPSGGSAGDTVSAFTAGFRGTPSTLADLADIVVDSLAQLNSSAQNIASPFLYTRNQEGCINLLVGWKQDDYTSIAVPSGFTEALEASTTTGSDQSLYLAYRIDTTPVVTRAGSLVVTGGASAISRSAVIALAAGYQTFTVARSVNTVVKAHAAGTKIEVEDAFVLAL